MKEAENKSNKISNLNDINTNNINNKENKKKIIMKCNKEFLTFDIKNYPSILQNYIPRNEWEAIAENGNNVIGVAYNLRKLEEYIKIPEYMNIVYRIIVFFSLVDFIFLIIYTTKEKVHEVIIYIALALMVVSCSIIIGFMFYNYSRELKEEKKLDEFIIEGMNEYINELNEKYSKVATFQYNHDNLDIECILAYKNI